MADIFPVLILVLGIVAVGSVAFKARITAVAPVIIVAAIAAPLVSGQGLHLREVVEGPFAYLDNAMWILCGAAFVQLLFDNGTMDFLFARIVGKQRGAVAQTLLLLLLIGLPGMLTGTAVMSLLTTGTLVGAALVKRGMDKVRAVELAVAGAFFGMLLPPVSLPGIIVVVSRQGTYPASFEGYFVPLLLMSLPSILAYAALSGKRLLEGVAFGEKSPEKASARCVLPLAVVILLTLGHNLLYWILPFLGYPLIYTIGFGLAVLLPAGKANALESAALGIRSVAPAIALMFVCGSVSEILTLTGVNGTIASYVYPSAAPVLFVFLFMAAIAVGGLLLGSPFAAIIGVMAGYLIGASLYTTAFLPLIATGGVLAVAMLIARRGGLVFRAGETLDAGEVCAADVLPKLAVPVLLVLAVCVALTLGNSTLQFLMV